MESAKEALNRIPRPETVPVDVKAKDFLEFSEGKVVSVVIANHQVRVLKASIVKSYKKEMLSMYVEDLGFRWIDLDRVLAVVVHEG